MIRFRVIMKKHLIAEGVSKMTFIESIKKIREKEGCYLYEALVIFATRMDNHKEYDGPHKERVIMSVEEIKKQEVKDAEHHNYVKRVRKLMYEGYGLKDAKKIVSERSK